MNLFDIDIAKIIPFSATELYDLPPQEMCRLAKNVSDLQNHMGQVKLEHNNFEAMVRRYTEGTSDASYMLALAEGIRSDSLSSHDREFLSSLFEEGAELLFNLPLEKDGDYRSKKLGALFGSKLGASNTGGALPSYYIYWIFEQIKCREINVFYHTVEVNDRAKNEDSQSYVSGIDICDFLDIDANESITFVAKAMGGRLGIAGRTIQNLVTKFRVLTIVRYLTALYSLCEREVLEYLRSKKGEVTLSEVSRLVLKLDNEYMKKFHWCITERTKPTFEHYVIKYLVKEGKIIIEDNRVFSPS
ncbi:hypothetical protein OPW33_01225 [Vibrio europaeus]|uniref:hypothetical protein n=1 Tax=Vibrio europaeus TaxID=300876 RepID=UPI002341E1BD|nr:hypothetical protein [Vibrio europaeus]MDC5837948.1 hypothetical protein [Vibrio europaeus]